MPLAIREAHTLELEPERESPRARAPTTMGDPDELYTLRNRFWLGAYQQAIAEGSNLTRLKDALKIERDEYMFRAYIALGQYNIPLGDIPDAPNTPISLQAVKLLATYLAKPDSRETVLATLGEWLSDPAAAGNTTLQLIAAIVYLYEDQVSEAIKVVHHGTTMEHIALLTQIFLKMDRLDLAQKQLQLMQQADEDATLTQLCTAMVFVATGGAKYQEAVYLYEELIDKFGASQTLLNGLASALMHMGRFDEAEKQLIDAASKGPNDPDTLVNLIACYEQMNKPADIINRYINQLKTAAPTHAYVKSLATIEGAFDRASTQFAA